MLEKNKRYIISFHDNSANVDILIERSLVSIMVSDSRSPNIPGCVANLWAAYPSLRTRRGQTTFNLHVQQQRMMRLIHHMTWNRLECLALEHATKAVSTPVEPVHWAEKIADVIDCRLDCDRRTRSEVLVIAPPQELRSVISDTTPFPFVHRSTHYLPKSAEDRSLYIANSLVDLVGQWLGYPKDPMSRLKSWYIGHLLDAAGPPILLLPSVWHSFDKAFKTHVLGSKDILTTNPSHLIPFRLQLVQHAISDKESDLRAQLRQLNTLLAQFRAGFPPTELGVLLPLPTRKRIAIDDTPGRQPKRKCVQVVPASAVAGPSSSFTPPTDGLQTLFDFFNALYPLIDNVNTPVDRLYSRAQTDPDAFLPFRECAPSRKRVLESPGPLMMASLTRRKVFSACSSGGV